MSAFTAKASRKMKKYAVLTREPRCFLGSFDFSWEQRKLGELVDVCSGRDYKHLSEGTIPVYGTGGYMLSVNDALSYDRDAIGIGRKGTIDRPYILKAPFWTVDTLFYAIPREKVDLNYAFDIFQNIDWKKKDESTGVPSLSKTAINDIDVLAPKHDEQQIIGQFFAAIDNLITLHQRKCVFLFGFFQAFISMIFTASTFSWEQRKLGDIADIVGGGTPSTGNQSYWDGDIDWYAPAEIADQIYANSSQKKITGLGYENSSAKMLPPGTVLFTSRAGIGKTAILTRKGCTNQGFQSIVPHRGELDSYFIFSRTEELKRYGELVGAGSTFVEVSGKQMAVMELMMPPTMREQQTIGGFFQQLDHLITLHQRECISFTARAGRLILTANKKRNTSSWEQRKVSDLAEKTYGGGTPTTSNEAYWNGDIPWIQSSDVVDGKLLGVEPRKWITQDGLNNSAAQLIPGNSIAIITRVGVGKLAFMPYSYATSQDFLSLSKLNAEPLFTVYACYKKLQSELNAVQGTSIKGITKDELLAKNIMVPRYAEQQQIGAFFKQLDNLITLHQRKPFLMKWRTSDANRNQTNRLVL